LCRRYADQLAARAGSCSRCDGHLRAIATRSNSHAQSAECPIADGVAREPVGLVPVINKFLVKIIRAKNHALDVIDVFARIGWRGGSAGACRTEGVHMINLVSTQTITPQDLAVGDIERMAWGKVGLRQIGLAQYSCGQQRRVASAEPDHCIGP